MRNAGPNNLKELIADTKSNYSPFYYKWQQQQKNEKY